MVSTAGTTTPSGVVASYGNEVEPVYPGFGVKVIVPSVLTVTLPLGTVIGVPITTGVPLTEVIVDPAGTLSFANAE